MKDTSPVPIEDKDLDLTFSLLDARHTGATLDSSTGSWVRQLEPLTT